MGTSARTSHHLGVEGDSTVVGGIRFCATDFPGALRMLDRLVADGDSHFVCFCEANLFAHAHHDPMLLEVVNRASMVLPDGVALMLLSRFVGRRLPARVPGPSFLLAACEHGIEAGVRHFFYGGADGVGERLAGVLSERFPGIEIAGYYSPPFRPLTEREETDVKQMIETAQPDLLWVGLGGPKQELWMANHVGKIKVPVMLGVGAAFDFHSGTVRWAPKWIRRVGMEWVYRAFTGGWRVYKRNVWCVSQTAKIVAREVWKERFSRR